MKITRDATVTDTIEGDGYTATIVTESKRNADGVRFENTTTTVVFDADIIGRVQTIEVVTITRIQADGRATITSNAAMTTTSTWMPMEPTTEDLGGFTFETRPAQRPASKSPSGGLLSWLYLGQSHVHGDATHRPKMRF